MLVHTATTYRSHRLGVEHVVERRGAEHLARGHPDQPGDVHHRLRGEPAVLLLGQVAQRDQRRAGLGVEGDELAGPGHDVGRQVVGAAGARAARRGGGHRGGLGHRSTSPITGSTDEHDDDGVGQEAAAHHQRQALQVHEARPPDVHPVGLGPAVGHQVAAELAAGGLDGHVDLALGHPEALGEDLEVVDQRLHRLVDAAAGRRRDLLVLDAVVAGRHLLDDLADDPDRLADLVEADRVPVEVVAEGADDDVELDLVVAEVRHRAAAGPTATPVDRRIGPVSDRASASSAEMLPTPSDRWRNMGWPVSSSSYSSSRGRTVSQMTVTSSSQPSGRSAAVPAGPDEVVVHPQAGGLFEEGQDHLPLAEAVDHHRRRRVVHAVGGHPHEVGRHPVELGHQHPDPVGPGRHLDAEQLLDGQRQDQLVVERATGSPSG